MSTESTPATEAGFGSHAGLFLIALATLMFEIVLARIFSVTLWYHFAFVAISIAMFGMSVGAIVVFLFPSFFAPGRAKSQMALGSLLFAFAIIASFLIHLRIPFNPDDATSVGVIRRGLTYVIISIPFIFSGIVVSLALTKFPAAISRLYAADLAGAALGCFLSVLALDAFGDGPAVVVAITVPACLAAVVYALDSKATVLTTASAVALLAFLFFTGFTTWRAQTGDPLIRPLHVKGMPETPGVYERWNSMSRIQIRDDVAWIDMPFGWGMSPYFPYEDQKVEQLSLLIDQTAGTVLTKYEGDPSAVEYLKYDISNIAHYIRPNSKVGIIGTGGGRDVLSALVFDQKEIIGIELNPTILEVANEIFGDFTGHLDAIENVTFINDEARSYFARTDEQFDIIQASLIDTWAASAAGAFVLSENSLYTTDAWVTFLNRLTPRGVVTFSHFYDKDLPGSMYRMTAMAVEALRTIGVEDPLQHIVIFKGSDILREKFYFPPVGTILVSKEPFTAADLAKFREIEERLGFEIRQAPGVSKDPAYAMIADPQQAEAFFAEFDIDVTPPHDDRPFFFHMLRFRDSFNPEIWQRSATIMQQNLKAVSVLGSLLATVLGLTFVCIIGPIAIRRGVAGLSEGRWLLLFFTCIGLGFMLIEISQMQRFVIFLGQPTSSLSVVLFSMLLSSGLGSSLTQNVQPEQVGKRGSMLLGCLLGLLVLYIIVSPFMLDQFVGSAKPTRVAVAIALLFPVGLFMGMAFPLGMKLGARITSELTPWYWGINGATSVCASVLAVVIALAWGFSATFWVGFVCYVFALLSLWLASRRAF